MARVLGVLAGFVFVVVGAVLWRPELLPHGVAISLGQLEVYRAPLAALSAVFGVVVTIAATLREPDKAGSPPPVAAQAEASAEPPIVDSERLAFGSDPAPAPLLHVVASSADASTVATSVDQPLFFKPALTLVNDPAPAPSKIRFDSLPQAATDVEVLEPPAAAAPAALDPVETPVVEHSAAEARLVETVMAAPAPEVSVAEAPVEEVPVEEASVVEPAAEPSPSNVVELAKSAPAAPEAAASDRRPFAVLTEAGDHYRMQGLSDDAMEHYVAALDLARDAYSEMPENSQAIGDLAAALTNVGDIYDEQGRLDAALQAHQESLELRRILAARSPDDKATQRGLSLGLERLADTREARGHRTRALDLYRESLPIAERLALQYPHDALLSKDLAVTRENVADLEAKLA